MSERAKALALEDVKSLLARAEAGEQLSEAERRRALAFLLFSRGECWPSALFAEFFRTDALTIERDLLELRELAAADARSLDLAGELTALMRQHVAALDRYLEENRERLRPQDFALLLRERRELIQSTLDRLAHLRGW